MVSFSYNPFVMLLSIMVRFIMINVFEMLHIIWRSKKLNPLRLKKIKAL